MAAAAALVLLGSSPHLGGDHQEDLIAEAAALHVFEEGGDRVVELGAERVHAHLDGRVVSIVVEVPATVDDGNEAAAGLTEPAGEQHLLSEQVGGAVEVVPVPGAAAADHLHRDELAGVVLLEDLRVFF